MGSMRFQEARCVHPNTVAGKQARHNTIDCAARLADTTTPAYSLRCVVASVRYEVVASPFVFLF